MDRKEESDDLASRLQRLEDRFAIADLVADYCASLDDRDLERFVSLFTEDATVRHRDGVMALTGRPEIREYYAARFANYGVTFHTLHSRTVTFEGPNKARGVVTGHAEMSVEGELVVAAIRYEDEYRREDGRWRFAGRELAFWYYMKLADLPAGFGDGLRKHYRGQRLPAELPESLATYQGWHNS